MTGDPRLGDLLSRYVEHHVATGERLDPATLVAGSEDLLGPLRRLIDRYHALDGDLDNPEPAREETPPDFEGFRTVEMLGRGGMGEVWKARDSTLDRMVAAKVLRRDSRVARRFGDFLKEARSLALFQDERIVRIYEYREEADPPVILMEYVDGFPLDRVGPSLEWKQKARVMLEVCEAVQHAHDLGVQHRDLKPANILLDQTLAPKILDFGLSGSDPDSGHLVGSPAYMAPEQLDPRAKIDARADVYAMGVILYQLLCGTPPFIGSTDEDLIDAVNDGRPRLPAEVEPEVPEPLQAVALKAMERDPEARYPAPREMALDLRAWLDGRPVGARPTLYGTVLGNRLRPHLEQIREWLRLKLIYPHEAERLRDAYARLESREDDWIVQARVLSWSQIALYMGAFLMVAGAFLYFAAHRFHEAVRGVVQPLLVLGLPLAGVNAAAFVLYRRQHRAVAVAFWLGGVLLLPLLLLILMHETGLGTAAPGDASQFFAEGTVSNRQLQVASFVALAWASWLAWRTRTVGLSTMASVLLLLGWLAVLTDLGMRVWLEEGRWDLLGLHLAPLLLVMALAGLILERARRAWFAGPLYVGAALLQILVLELIALDGKAFSWLGLSMARFQSSEVDDPVLLDTLAAMALAGLLFYLTARLVERYGTPRMAWASTLLVVISPFAILEPVAWLVQTEDYAPFYHWLYLLLAVAITVLSHNRQRRSFYFAGLINTAVALWLITARNEWFDEPLWAVAVVAAGLLALGIGLALAAREPRGRTP